MKSDEFKGRYQILTQAAEGPVRTYHAMARTRAVVMVHFIDGTPEQRHSLLTQLDRLDASARTRVVEKTEVDGTPVVVTRFIFDFTSLGDWLALNGATTNVSVDVPQPFAPLAAVEPPPGTPPRTVGSETPSGFTGLFQRPLDPASPPPPAAAPPEPGARAAGSGSFTDLFPMPPEEPAAPSPAPDLAPEPSSGGFTQLFRYDLGAAAAPPVEKPPARSLPDPPSPSPVDDAHAPKARGSSSFTALFRPPTLPTSDSSMLATPAPPPANRDAHADLDRLRPSSLPPSSPVREEPFPRSAPGLAAPTGDRAVGPDYGESYLDRLHAPSNAPLTPARPEPAAWGVDREPGLPGPAALPTPGRTGPSEFTRVISASPPPPAMPASIPAPTDAVVSAPPGAAHGRMSRRVKTAIIFAILAAIVMVIVVVLLPGA